MPKREEPAIDYRNRAPWRDKWNEVIFGSDASAGRFFDIVLLTLILQSVLSVLLESVRSIREAHGLYFRIVEWVFTFIFALEYAARLISAKKAKQYAFSFFGIVDLLAIAPVYVSLLFGVRTLLPSYVLFECSVSSTGLPEKGRGRLGIAAAAETGGRRSYAIMEQGFFRLDDGGATWQHSTKDRTTESRPVGWHSSCGVFPDWERTPAAFARSLSDPRESPLRKRGADAA